MASDPRPRDASGCHGPAAWPHFHSHFHSTPQDVRAALAKVMTFLKTAGLTSEDLITAELVLAEALNNVVEHAYSDTPRGKIQIDLNITGSTVGITITDHGQAMPGGQLPLSLGPAQLDCASRADLPEGGWGWQVIRGCVAAVTYQRAGNENLLNIDIEMSAPQSRA